MLHLQIHSLLPQYEATKEPYAKTVSTLAGIEILEYNKTDLERMLGNERRAREKQEQQIQSKSKKHNQEI